MRLIIMGPPGGGKGTHSSAIASRFNITQLSTGEVFRSQIQQETQLGKVVAAYINRGEFVPDELTCDVVKDRLGKPDMRVGFLLDGFPRSLAQAQILDDYLAKMGREIDRVIYLDVPEEESVRRLLSRAKIEHRSDDTEPVIRKRMEVYKAQTVPLLDYYVAQGKLSRVEGTGSVEEVAKNLDVVLADIAKS